MIFFKRLSHTSRASSLTLIHRSITSPSAGSLGGCVFRVRAHPASYKPRIPLPCTSSIWLARGVESRSYWAPESAAVTGREQQTVKFIYMSIIFYRCKGMPAIEMTGTSLPK